MATNFNIDYNRGVIKRVHPPSGIDVYMYRDDPGVWLNAYGGPVTEALAKEAGFNTAKYLKEKLRKERMTQAAEAIRVQLEMEPEKETVAKERGGFKVVDIGAGRFHLKDPDGNVLTPLPLPETTAFMLLDQMSPIPLVPEVKDEPPAEPEKAEETVEVVNLPKVVKKTAKK